MRARANEERANGDGEAQWAEPNGAARRRSGQSALRTASAKSSGRSRTARKRRTSLAAPSRPLGSPDAARHPREPARKYSPLASALRSPDTAECPPCPSRSARDHSPVTASASPPLTIKILVRDDRRAKASAAIKRSLRRLGRGGAAIALAAHRTAHTQTAMSPQSTLGRDMAPVSPLGAARH